MSWWVGVEIDTGGPQPVEISDRNVTWNYSPLFQKVIDHPDGLRGLHGAPCSEAAGRLRQAADRIQAMSSAEAASLVRGGGTWGNRAGAYTSLLWLAHECEKHPNARVYVH